MGGIPRPALVLGIAGLIPFYASAVVLVVSSLSLWSADAEALDGVTPAGAALIGFVVYGASILSFLGGIRWGLALRDTPVRTMALVYSVTPSIAGWAAAAGALMATVHTGALAPVGAIFAALFLGQYLWDRQADRDGAPIWYPRLRFILTVGVLGACLLVAASQALTRV